MRKALGDGTVIDATLLEDDPNVVRIKELEADLRTRTRERDDAALEARRAREDANRALSMLRHQLTPLYRALQGVFGELDAAGVTENHHPEPGTATTAAAPKNVAVWQAWKEKFPPAVGKVIDALLLHGEMNHSQIKIAARLGSSTVTDCVYKLNKAGLINKNGGKVSLKQL